MPDAVLITGASTGIGRACALHLARRGMHVLATVRRPADAESLHAEASSARFADALTPILMDVADAASVSAAAAQLSESLGPAGLRAIVNNAGIGVVGPIERLTDDDWRRQFEVNVIGAVSVTRAFLPLLRAFSNRSRPATPSPHHRPARIIMMSSVGGRVAQPFLAPYSASKFALEAISDALRIEFRHQPIAVSLIEPGAVKSEIWRKGDDSVRQFRDDLYAPDLAAMRTAAAASEAGAVPALVVARAVERCITAARPPARIVIGRDARVATLLKRWLPDRWMDRILIRAFKLPRYPA